MDNEIEQAAKDMRESQWSSGTAEKAADATPAVITKPAPRRGRTAWLLGITALAVVVLTFVIAYSVQKTLAASATDYGVIGDGVTVFNIEGPQWEFHPRAIAVNPGDSIRILLTSPDVTHGFAINELGINTSYSPNDTGLVEVMIPADTPEGTYTMYCSIFCGSGHSHMKGTILVGDSDPGAKGALPYAATSLMVVIFGGFVFFAARRGER